MVLSNKNISQKRNSAANPIQHLIVANEVIPLS